MVKMSRVESRCSDEQLKPLLEPGKMSSERQLMATMSWPHLIALGIGAIVGSGILTLIGVGADKAGPAVIVSFLIAGLICTCAALAYAELSTLMPVAGGAYTYAYVVLGELFAWIVGWSLILEYSLVVSAVAVGWAGYAAPLLHNWFGLPMLLMQGPELGGMVNLPAIAIILVVSISMLIGIKESATFSAVLVAVKLIALLVFVAAALPDFNAGYFQPFMPFGFAKNVGVDGSERGVMVGAAIMFFAFYGFDTIATAAEETLHPERDLTIGIVGSMLTCIVVYCAVGVATLGALPYGEFADSPEPLALVMRHLGRTRLANFIAVAVMLSLPTVILAFFYGQSRIFYAMARDGVLPSAFARVSVRGIPVRSIVLTALLVGSIGGMFPLADIAALANAGTLTAFITVTLCMLILRLRNPQAILKFRTPFVWLTGPVAVVGCLYLFANLPQKTQTYFLLWNLVGLGIYVIRCIWRRSGKKC